MIQIFFKTVFNDPEKYVQFRKFLHVPEPENIIEKKIILIFQTIRIAFVSQKFLL